MGSRSSEIDTLRPHSRDELRALVQGYFDSVLNGTRVVGKLERKFVQRHYRDLERSLDREGDRLRFNEERAFHILEFAERYIVHTKSKWRKKRFRFTEQSAWIAAILWIGFGWELWDPEEQAWRRRFQILYICTGRKQGKTMIAAIIAIYLGAFDHEPAAEVYFAATTRDQAKIGWKQAKACVKIAPDKEFRDLFVASADSTATIGVPDSDSIIKALAADDDNLDGLFPSGAVIDELHKHKTGGLVDVLKTGMGARPEPMMVLITTRGAKRQGVCWDYDYTAVRLLNGIIEDDRFLGYIATLDLAEDDQESDGTPGDAWDDERVWAKANPNLGETVKLSHLRAECVEAKNMPARLAEFKRKELNCWEEDSFSWLSVSLWDQCAGVVDLKKMKDLRCFIGSDLSSSSDYTAAVALWGPDDEGRYYVKPWLWIPRDTLLERRKKDRVDVMRWAREKVIHATPGPVIDHDQVKFKILALAKVYDVKEIPMDPANATNLQTQLMKHGMPVVSMRQGALTMSPAIKALEVLIKQKLIVHDGNECLRWMFTNVAAVRDHQDNILFSKSRAPDRFDGMQALAMSVGRSIITLPFHSVYSKRDVREL